MASGMGRGAHKGTKILIKKKKKKIQSGASEKTPDKMKTDPILFLKLSPSFKTSM